jgi:hypothetical protein
VQSLPGFLLLHGLVTALLCAPVSAAAQTASGSTRASGSGTSVPTIEEKISALLKSLPERKEQYRKQLIDTDEEEKGRIQARIEARQRLAKLWQECRGMLRRANRDTKFGVLERCMRAQLLLEHAALRQELPLLGEFRGVNEAARLNAMERTQELTDAMMAVVDAIDTHVFSTEDALLEMRQKLRTQYRIPYWTGLIALRHSRLEGFLVFVSKKFHAVLMDFPHSPPEQSFAVFLCLEQAAAELALPESADLTSVALRLTQLRRTLRTCTLLLEELTDLLDSAVPPEPAATPKQ